MPALLPPYAGAFWDGQQYDKAKSRVREKRVFRFPGVILVSIEMNMNIHSHRAMKITGVMAPTLWIFRAWRGFYRKNKSSVICNQAAAGKSPAICIMSTHNLVEEGGIQFLSSYLKDSIFLGSNGTLRCIRWHSLLSE